MIGLAFADAVPTNLAPHNAIDFELHSQSTDTFAAFSYGTDIDWTKPTSCDDVDVIGKRPTSAHIPTLDNHVDDDFNNTKRQDVPVDNGFVFDQDDQTESNLLFDFDQPKGEVIFPELPPLYRGQPDVHMRNGILNARRLAAAGEPDAEKAFFVANLSEVYRQHQRWMGCLPEIQPFYGALLVAVIIRPLLTNTPQRLNVTRTPTSSDSWHPSVQVSTVLLMARSTRSSPSVEAPSTPLVSSSRTHARQSLLFVPQQEPA